MSWLYGLLGIHETQYDYVSKIGQELVFEATAKYLERVNQDMALALGVFVDGATEAHQERYLLPSGGYMQARGGGARSGAVKGLGQWDVGYPLLDFGDQIALTDVAMAYLSPAEYQKHVEGVVIRASNTVRREILHRLFNNSAYTFADPVRGNVTVQPLANGDGVLYPPVLGTMVETTENHYLTTTYAANAISDANNPYATIHDELAEHFSRSTGGQNIIVFINKAQAGLTRALKSFIPMADVYTVPASDQPQLVNLPDLPSTAEVIGRLDGCWVVIWDYIPAGYLLAVHGDEPAPLKQRIDPINTGLPRGLALVRQSNESPLVSAEWRWRFGIGTGNRLNGVVLQLRGDNDPYEAPSGFGSWG